MAKHELTPSQHAALKAVLDLYPDNDSKCLAMGDIVGGVRANAEDHERSLAHFVVLGAADDAVTESRALRAVAELIEALETTPEAQALQEYMQGLVKAAQQQAFKALQLPPATSAEEQKS